MMCAAAPMMPPMTTIAAPAQNSHQTGPMGRAIPPTVKPMMMIAATAHEIGRPWCASCPYDWPVCASRPCAPVFPVTAVDAGCSVTPSSSPSLTLLLFSGKCELFSGKCETWHQPAPGHRLVVVRVGVRLGLVSHLAYDGMLGR